MAIDAISSTSPSPLRVVGIGASAGGLDAYTRLFRALPARTGLAYLVVPHLSPTHPSELTQLMARVASIPVAEATDGTKMEPDHLYVLPPDKVLRIADGHLRLDPRPPRDGAPTVIDTCFTSLAEAWGPSAIGVVLSGSGSDGAAGLQAIKAGGGTTYAQDFFSAAYDSMPRSAVDAGGVDFTLPPEAIAHSLAQLATVAAGGQQAGERSPKDAAAAFVDEAMSLELSVGDTTALETILHALQAATGVDFPRYKRASLSRRVRRRMDQVGVSDFSAYAITVREDKAELQMLFKAVLIHVTEFFRDPETFAVLQSTVIPALLANRPNGGPIRVWVVGCASGEEVYSVAMAFLEVEAALGREVPVRIFATDLSEDILVTARLGRYPSEISTEVSPERLAQFFVPVEGGYQIQKRIRDMCVFARQDITRDPPYAQLDLILCRNLLIYLDPALQHRVLRVLHYALHAGGFLALGPAESVSGSEQLFSPLDRIRSLFMRRSTPSRLQGDLGWSGQQRPLLLPTQPPGLAPIPWTTAELRQAAAQTLFTQHPTGSVIVNADLEIRHFQGTTSPYLEPPSGGPTVQLLRMAHPDLRLILGRLVRKAHKDAGEVRRRDIQVTVGTRVHCVDVAVLPVTTSDAEGEHFLVLFETIPSTSKRDAPAEENTSNQWTGPSEAHVLQLEQELVDTKEYLQSVIDQQDETHAELQAAYEASLSLNEEFQSTNEELESTKEELQSVNEELHTLNDQLKQRNEELGTRAAEVTALLEAMEIPLLLLTPDLRLQAFNAKAEATLKLTPNGLGQSIAKVGLPQALPELPGLVQRVLAEESFLEQEVKDEYGRPYALRLWPVAQPGGKPSAVVAALIDISRLKQALDHANQARAFSDAVVEAVGEPLVVLDQDVRIVSLNQAFAATFGAERDAMIGRPFWEIGAGKWDQPEVRGLLDHIFRTGQGFDDRVIAVGTEPNGRRIFEVSGQQIIQPGSGTTNVLLAIRDLTERKKVEQQIIAAGRMQAVSQLAGGVAHEINNQMTAVLGFADVLAKSPHLDEDEVQSLTYILKGARRAADITRQLLAFGRRQAAEPVVTGLNTLVAATEGLLVRILGPDLHLELALGDGVGNIRVDRARFEQILVNLVLNARDAMTPGGRIVIQTSAIMVTDSTPQPPIPTRVPRGLYARLVVEDTGAGIEEATLSRIFEPFFTTKPQGLGTGLGLASVYGTVKQSDGFIWAKSEPGRGTTFTIDLPCVEADDSQVPPSLPTAAGGGDETIVVVEDEDAVRLWLARSLRQFGYTVLEASDGVDALRLINERVALVLTDVVMVGMGGVELRKRLAEICPSLPVLFMSAHTRDELLARRMVDQGIVVLEKPFDLAVLMQKIRSILDTHRA